MIKNCVVCLGLFSGLSFASDHSRYEPVVPIEGEPSHRLVLESKSIRMFDVTFPPGKQSLWHMHSKDSVLICLEGADVPSEEPEKELVKRPPIPSGLIYYRGYAEKPFVHRITNVSPTRFRILDIEVLTEKNSVNHLPALGNSFSTVIENDRVRVSKINITTKNPEVVKFQGPYLIVALSVGKLKLTPEGRPAAAFEAEPGLSRVGEAADHLAIENAGDTGVELAIVEVK